ncbi:MAG TPA: hypothetical protein VMJ93_07570 [Verrucomicrobiae bacterium]|nr:hypothetical protein [Verrucomicrobiae bacterium]
MRRSFGVTFSVIVVFLGCAFTLLICLLMAIGIAAMTASPQAAVRNLPRFAILFDAVLVVVLLGCVAWGILTGAGLLRLRPWARISILIFSGLLLFFCLPGLVVFLFMPSSVFSQPNLPANFPLLMKAIMAAVYGSIAALGGIWLWFFNSPPVKAQFKPGRSAGFQPDLAPPFSREFPPPPDSLRSAGRPIGVTIIGIYLLVGAVSSIFIWPVYKVAFPEIRPYAMVFGFFPRDLPAVLATVIMGGVAAVAGWGLLKLQNWARLLAIAVQAITLLNILMMLLLPGSRARFSQILLEYQAAVMPKTSPAAPVPGMGYSVWAGMVMVLPIAAVIIWYLVTRRQVFLAAAETPPHSN